MQVRSFFHIILLTAAIIPLSSYAQPEGWEKSLRAKAHRKEGGFYFVGLQQVAECLETYTYYSNKVRKAILYFQDDKLTVTALNPFVVHGQSVLQMPLETKYDDGEIFVPVKFFIPLLKKTLFNGSSGHKGSNGSDRPASDVTGVIVEQRANGTLIKVTTSRQFKRASVSTGYSRKWLYLYLYGGAADNSLARDIDKGLIRNFKSVQTDELLQLSFQVSEDISDVDFSLSIFPNEIWLSIPYKKNLDIALIDRLKNEQKKWLFDKIVIDPGHGGRDPGTHGRSRVEEKKVVLKIAKKLKKLLVDKLNIDVVMTRDSDRYVSLSERTRIANSSQAKLFISIHANWNRNSRVGGATTYFLGMHKSEEALEIAQRENSAIKYDTDEAEVEELNEENIILATMAQNSFNKESQDFAAMIQRSLRARTKLNDRGVKQAGFQVLVGASMPNVLIETAFLSNRKEERFLNSSSFQSKIAYGIFESIKEFKEKYERSVLSTN